MSVVELLLGLGRLGIRLEADGERLRYRPRSALTPDLLARLKEHKAELLAMLGANAVAPEIDQSNAVAVWRAALDRLEGDPLLPPDVMDALRSADVRWAASDAKAKPTKPVCRCGSTVWRDVPIHGGQSIRRDCARCSRFVGFTVWHGRPLHPSEN